MPPQAESSSLKYLGYEIDVVHDAKLANRLETSESDLYDPERFDPAVVQELKRIYEADSMSEASTTVCPGHETLDLSQYLPTLRRIAPPTSDEGPVEASPEPMPMPDPDTIANELLMNEKSHPSPSIKSRSGPESSAKGQKTRKKTGRNGKGQARKSLPNKQAMASQKAVKPAAEASAAASGMGNTVPVRPESPADIGAQEIDTAGWVEVRRKDKKKKKGAMAQKVVAKTNAMDSGNEQPSEAQDKQDIVPAATEPTVAIAHPSSSLVLVLSRTSSPGVPTATSAEVVITPEVPAATSSEPAAEETRRAVEEQLDIQIAPVREEEIAAPVQQVHSAPCIVDTERWRQRVFKRMAEEKARQAEQAEQEERRRWEASYARRQLEQRSKLPLSSSQNSNLSEVASPQIPIDSASVLARSQQYTPGPGKPVVQQQQALNAERAGECGYFSACCAHIPWWNQPQMGYQPTGCCCNHAGDVCCLCRPPNRWGPLARGVVMELVRPAANASIGNNGLLPAFTGGFPIGQVQEYIHSRPPVSAAPRPQNVLPSGFSVPPGFSLLLPPRRRSVSLASTPAPRVSSQLAEQPAAEKITTPTSPKMSATEESPSVTSTVKDAPAVSPLLPAQRAVQRVRPVVPLNFCPPAKCQGKVSTEKITRSSAEEGRDMSTKAHQATPQGELAPSVASLFEQARQTAAVRSPVIQVDPAATDSHPASPKESDNAQTVETEGLVDKLRITDTQVEPDLRSPSLYFDAKQQMSSSPAESSGSSKSSPQKSCLKTKPSTPSPPASSPPRSSVRFLDGSSPGSSPDTKNEGLELFPTPRLPRVNSGESFSRASSHSCEVKDTAEHVQSLWKDPEFADLQIVLTPYTGPNGPTNFQDKTQTTFQVHKSIVSGSPFLKHVMDYKKSRDGHVAVINARASPHFTSAYAFEKALSTLYGMEIVTKETLRRVTLESIGRSEDDLTGLHEDSLTIMQIAFAFSYGAAGAFLANREIIAQAVDLALDLLTWNTAEYITAFGMTAFGWTITCTDILVSPDGSPRSVNSEAVHIGRQAESEFVHVWADLVRRAVFQFFARNMLPGFYLYDRAQSKHVQNRIPKPLWALPGSFLSNPLLENIRFGDANSRPARIDILVISGMLISLPYSCFMILVDMLKSYGKLTVGVLKKVVETREERRLQALRMYHRGTWAPGEVNPHVLGELAYREYVSGELNAIQNDDAVAITVSVQRIAVGLDVPNMHTVASGPQQEPILAIHAPAPSQQRPASTAATNIQATTNNEPADDPTDRGRQRRKKKKKKKAKKTKADTSADPTVDDQEGVQHG